MREEKVQIQIPEQGGQVGPTPFEKDAKDRFNKIDNILIAVVASVVISGIAIVVSVVGIFLDQLHYNNVAYNDYSQRLEERNQIFKDYKQVVEANKKLLEQIVAKSGENK